MQTQYHSEGFSLAFVKGHIEGYIVVRTTETIVGTQFGEPTSTICNKHSSMPSSDSTEKKNSQYLSDRQIASVCLLAKHLVTQFLFGPHDGIPAVPYFLQIPAPFSVFSASFCSLLQIPPNSPYSVLKPLPSDFFSYLIFAFQLVTLDLPLGSSPKKDQPHSVLSNWMSLDRVQVLCICDSDTLYHRSPLQQ